MNEINHATSQAKHGGHIGLDAIFVLISQTKTWPLCIIKFDRGKDLSPVC